MSKKSHNPISLKPEKLRARLTPERVPWEDSRAIPRRNGHALFQPRAIQALGMALRIPAREYNVYVCGDANMGRTYFIQHFLAPEAAKAPTPRDWVYLYNFDDPDRPVAVGLPAGRGRAFKTAMTKAMSAVRGDIPNHFDQESFHKQREGLVKSYNEKREALFTEMENEAGRQNFSLAMDESGALTLTPVINGKPIADDEYEALEAGTRKRLKSRGDELLIRISRYLRRMSQNEQNLRREETELQRATAKAVIEEHLAPARAGFGDDPKLARYLDAVEADILQNVDLFLPREPQAQQQSAQLHAHAHGQEPQPADDVFYRYEVNLFVDNSRQQGAPVVIENHPTPFNLLGSIEREAEMGALYTDFTLIRAGAVHRANQGFLILNMEDLLAYPASWEGLLRALRLGVSRIEDPVDPEQVRARTIEPEPIPLNLKILLVGTDETYEQLLYSDDRFQKYFKLKAHLQPTAPRTAQNIRNYLYTLGRIVREADLPPFSRDALAGLVDQAGRLAEDQKKLSLAFPLVRERMIEAAAIARMRGDEVVSAEHLAEAVAARDFRANLFEEEFMADYDREVIKVATGGSAVGRANGLSVTLFGDYEFGLPHQISCTVGVGHGGILDLEREAQLGGPIHTKGMMIIKSYLLGLFAVDKPLVLSGNLCFEQSYAGIEGDSASGAELAALLSALSGAPIDLSYAFTGAVSQSGAIMAVGGVNRKIEGFFEVCRRRGLTGRQGVILPADNVVNLMLKDEILDAVGNGLFHIHPVRSIEEALHLLTGVPAGRRGKGGRFPKGSLYDMVDRRLAELCRLARKADRPGR
ncbi:MAG: Lon protease family protein [Desulfovibrio aminophilus]|uniref:Lon protease family protein n=1 Tax=Desulfovibrio aminophilus TaxID=81425 RepID=UPI002A41A299|nr:AAA family ATPase [Desulfovibrionaceae bacterium]